jgi:hypothetical protein
VRLAADARGEGGNGPPEGGVVDIWVKGVFRPLFRRGLTQNGESGGWRGWRGKTAGATLVAHAYPWLCQVSAPHL